MVEQITNWLVQEEGWVILLYYGFLGIWVQSMVYLYYKNRKKGLGVEEYISDIFKKVVKHIPNSILTVGVFGISLLLVSGRYFLNTDTPYASFLDLGATYVFSEIGIYDLWKGWNYSLSLPQFVLVPQVMNSAILIIQYMMKNIWISVKVVQLICLATAFLGMTQLVRKIALNTIPEDTSYRDIFTLITGWLAGLIYIYNPYYLVILNGVLEYSLAYAVLPWIVWWLYQVSLRSEIPLAIIIQIIPFALVSSLATTNANITLVFTNGIPLFILGSLLGIQLSKYTIRYFFVGLLIGFIILLSSLYYLIPTVQNMGINTIDISYKTEERTSAYVKDFYSPTKEEILFLQNKEGIVSEELGYALKDINWRYAIPFAIASIMMIISICIYRNRILVSLWVSGMVSAWFALGYSESFLYRTFDKVVPYFWVVRTPGRFMMIFVLVVSILSSVTVMYLLSILFSKNRYIFWQTLIIGIGAGIIIFAGRGYSAVIRTFDTIPSLADHYPGITKIIRYLDSVNPNQEYRILDLTRDDDGSWNHTRILEQNQRVFRGFETILPQYSEEEWVDILSQNNVKYVVSSGYQDYCDDTSSEGRNTVSCTLLQNNQLTYITSTLQGYTVYEVPNVKKYISSQIINQDFGINPQVVTADTSVEITVAERYSPFFVWQCDDQGISTQPLIGGLTQIATLPANSECTFHYQKPVIQRLADYMVGLLIVVSIIGGFFLLYEHIWSRKKHTSIQES